MSFSTAGLPNSAACASIEVNTIVNTVTATNIDACSMFANRHHLRHRDRFCSSISKT
jgi:hypothetical protein